MPEGCQDRLFVLERFGMLVGRTVCFLARLGHDPAVVDSLRDYFRQQVSVHRPERLSLPLQLLSRFSVSLVFVLVVAGRRHDELLDRILQLGLAALLGTPPEIPDCRDLLLDYRAFWHHALSPRYGSGTVYYGCR